MAHSGPDLQQVVADCGEALVQACRVYVDGVDGLLDALERDVYQAADRCWRLQEREVQLRGGVLRHKAVMVQEAVFQPDAEQHDLAGSLEQWRAAVASSAASAALEVLLAEAHLLAVVGRLLHPLAPPPPSLDQLAAVLHALLSAQASVAALPTRSLRRTLDLLGLLGLQAAAAWRAAGGDDPSALLAAHGGAPREVVAVLTAQAAPAAVQPEGAEAAAAGGVDGGIAFLPADQAAAVEGLRGRQAALLEELSDGADMLRFWGRRGEKAAAGEEGAGREGDVPPMLAEAQAALWAAGQAYDEAQAASDLRTRQLVCQRYRPLDLAALQAAADQYGDGERLPAQPSLSYEPEFVQERGWARTQALHFLRDDALVAAAEKLYQLRYLLLEAQLPPEAGAAWQQLLLRIAEALLNGSTPPAAAPLLATLLQQGLRRQGAEQLASVGERDQARLVPMICAGLAPQAGGGRPLLRPAEGLGLAQSLLQPEDALNAGRLTRFYDALRMVVDGCAAADLPAAATTALLSPFDATRFAVLACEGWGEGGEGEAAGRAGDEGEAAGRAGGVSMQQVLALAHACLVQAGAEGAGLALLEGLLTLQPASFLAAALQLALCSASEEGRRSVLAMLCRVPADLLPAAAVADALAQVAEAMDGGQLAPPFLPYELLGRLYRSPHVMRSLRASVERGMDAAAAEALSEQAGQHGGAQLWTARLGGDLPGGPQHGGADALAPAASGSSRMAQGGAVGRAVSASSRNLVLLPVQPSPQPLAALLQQVVGSLLSCLLRRAGASLDAAALSEEVLQLLDVVMMPAAEQGPWLLEWLWRHLYQEALRPFLAGASAAVDGGGGALTAAFLSYWASLPWRQATFHAASPAALAPLRLHLTACPGDGAAAVLLRELDFAPVVAKAVAAAAPPREQPMYSLGEEEEEEEEGAAAAGQERGAWAAELGLLALHACVVLPPQERPAWLQHLLEGAPSPLAAHGGAAAAADEEEGDSVAVLMRSPLSAAMLPLLERAAPHQPLLPHMLAAACWRRLAATVHAEQAAAGSAAPWLLLPLLLAPDSLVGDVGGRLVQAAALLSAGAALAESAAATQCAAGMVAPLLLCTLCQGTKHSAEAQAGQQRAEQAAVAAEAAAEADAAAQRAQQEQVVVPEGFPLELLADTVEGQQLLLLQQQEREQRERLQQLHLQQQQPAQGQLGGGGVQAAVDEAQGRQLPLVEVQRCWSLTADQHAQLVHQALLPLAAGQASLDAAARLQPQDCPRELAAAGRTGGDDALHQWRPPALPDLLQAAALAAATAGSGGDGDSEPAGLAAIAALLAPLTHAPLTILTTERLSFANAELPLDTEAALFVSVGPGSGGGGSAAPGGAAPRAGLHQTLAALLPGARRRAQQALLAPGAVDAALLRGQIRLAVEAACKAEAGLPLAGCLLRLLYACPALHACAEAVQLGEGLLRFLAAPQSEGGPLGQGAAASALLAEGGDAEAGSVLALEVADDDAEEEAGGGAGGAAAGRPAVSQVHVAVSAAAGLPAEVLLGLARGAADAHAPLTAALAAERLRLATTVLPKEEWQGLAEQVLHVAVRADAEPGHPFDLVAAWLAALPWVADSRWRRLPAGAHSEALAGWVEALDLRVTALRLAQPEDFLLEGGSPGGSSPNRLLSSATDRFKAVRQRLAGQQPGEDAAAHLADDGGAGPAADPGAPHVSEAGEQQLGQKLRSGFRSLLGKGGGGSAEQAPGEAGKKGWGDKMRSRLARLGRGGEEEEAQARAGVEERAAASSVPPPAPGSARSGPAYSGPGLGTVAEEGGGVPASEALRQQGLGAADAGQPGLDVGSGAPGGSAAGQAVRQRISSGLQAVGRGLSRVKTRLADRQAGSAAHDEVAQQDQDVAVRVGLAAFAVSAYIKSVLCPSFASRLGGDSVGPPTPTLPRGGHLHRQTSSLGSVQRMDADYVRELDRVLEARSELDSLDSLAACPLLQLGAQRYAPFLREAPLLLSAATGVEGFGRSLQRLLFGHDAQLLAWL